MEGKQSLLESLAAQGKLLEDKKRGDMCLPIIYLSILKAVIDKNGVHATIGRFMSAFLVFNKPIFWNDTLTKDIDPYLIGALQIARESGNEAADIMLRKLEDESQFVGAMTEGFLQLLSGTNRLEPIRKPSAL